MPDEYHVSQNLAVCATGFASAEQSKNTEHWPSQWHTILKSVGSLQITGSSVAQERDREVDPE